MPRYDFACDKCGCKWEQTATVNESGQVLCPHCGGRTTILITTPPYVINDLQPYFDRGLGVHVTSRSDRKSKMIGRGVKEAGDWGLKEAKQDLEELRERRLSKRP